MITVRLDDDGAATGSGTAAAAIEPAGIGAGSGAKLCG
jgi:hypothetical protein